MTDGERMVWAAVYATRWSQALEKRETIGVPMSVPTCIEEAWAAVSELRGAREAVRSGWGDGDAVLAHLDDILGITHS